MQVTIIGLGQIGVSVGLALRPYRQHIRRVGLDRLLPVAGKARAMGAIDKTAVNLSLAVAKADFVLLALPFSAMEETLAVIGEALPAHAVVLDTAPGKEHIARWIEKYLPETIAYASVWPVMQVTNRKARADLFQGGRWLVSESARLQPRGWRLTQALAALCGAEALELPAAAIDAISARHDLLPRLLSVGLLNALVDQPGWFDARKLTGRPFAGLSAGMAQPDDDDTLLAMLREQPRLGRQGVQTLLDALHSLRQSVAKADAQALESLLHYAQEFAHQRAEQHLPALPADEALRLLLEFERL